MTYPVTGSGGPVSFHNNVIWNGYNGQTNPVTGAGHTMYLGAWGFGGVCTTSWSNPPNIFANNIAVSSTWNSIAWMLRAGWGAPAQSCNTLTYKNNDYYGLSGTVEWYGIKNATYTTLPTWQAAVLGNDTHATESNPNFAGTGGNDTTCYSGFGVPAQPTCATNYQLRTGSGLIGTGFDLTQAPYDLTLPSTDYFNVAIPNGVGTGYNYGADGAQH